MQTLGLTSENKRSEGRLKNFFWPKIEDAWDVDYLGQQGLWVCTLAALFTLFGVMFAGNLVVVVIAVLAALFYWVGGLGIRQGNWLAAAAVFAIYALNAALLGFGIFTPIGFIRIAFAVILLLNVRAAYLASEWKATAANLDGPKRFDDTLADKYNDVMPAKLWPILQIPFIVLTIVMLLLTLVGAGFIVAQRLGLLPHPH